MSCKQLSIELRKIFNDPPEGIRIEINEHDMSRVNCQIDGPEGTPYHKGVFQYVMYFLRKKGHLLFFYYF